MIKVYKFLLVLEQTYADLGRQWTEELRLLFTPASGPELRQVDQVLSMLEQQLQEANLAVDGLRQELSKECKDFTVLILVRSQDFERLLTESFNNARNPRIFSAFTPHPKDFSASSPTTTQR